MRDLDIVLVEEPPHRTTLTQHPWKGHTPVMSSPDTDRVLIVVMNSIRFRLCDLRVIVSAV